MSDYMFHQPDFESVLRGRAVARPETTTLFGWEAVGLRQDGDAVTLTLSEASVGRTQQVAGKTEGKGARYGAARATRTVTAAILVGSDGANSFVRRQIEGTQVDHGATHRSLIVDILPFKSSEELAGGYFGRDSFIQAGIRNPLTYVAIAEPFLRFEEMLRPDDDAADFDSLDHVHELLGRWLAPDEYRILRADVYQWDALVADPWQVGRVLLAGDAAHEMPPHLGQGMCSGVRDVMNLGWKLGRVIRGESPAALLGTYETERRPHITELVVQSAQMANQVESIDPATLGQEDSEPTAWPRPRLGAGVRAGDDDALAGTLSAQPTLDSGERFDDVVGYRFAVLGTAAVLDGLGPEARGALQELGARIVPASSGEAADWLRAAGVEAVVIRPDRYVFGSARTGPELEALVARLGELLR